jgi:hypothetical protein
MRAGSTILGSTRRWATAVALLTLIVCASASGLAWAAGTQASPIGSPAAGPAAAQSPSQLGDDSTPAPPTITWSIAPTAVVYGETITVQGTVAPATDGQTVTVAVDGATVATTASDAYGVFSATFVATVGGTVTATLDDGTVGPPLTLSVAPKVTIKAGAALPWGVTKLSVTVLPATYAGRVAATVYHHGKKVAVAAGHPAAGKLVLKLHTPGVGAFSVRVVVAAVTGLVAPPLGKATLNAPWHRVAVGSKGRYAHILLTRLVALRFRVPGVSSRISAAAGDSIVAFQKAYGLPRTYVFGGADWRKLDTARLIKVRHKSPKTHIEIDKTRQILMIVKGGKPYGIIAVSTGATGNTPVGRFHILRKAPSTSTWLGSAILWRTMDFYGNFAMHGYPEVPPYPASHGCVREPMWVADWTYQHSWVGEAVYIYLS